MNPDDFTMTHSTHAWTDQAATIGVPGIPGPLRVLHVTDSHISVPHQEADRPYAHYGERMDRLFADYPTLDTFAAQMEHARAERHDLIALTGDHVNYPSPTAVAAVHGLLRSAGRRSMFTAGNHDWSYAGMPGSPDDRRREWRERSLLPLYRGRTPHADSLDLGGVRFVAIDNSTRQVDPEQMAFFTDRLAGGLPVVLLVHMPFRLPDDHDPYYAPPPSPRAPIPLCGDPESGSPADVDRSLPGRERARTSGNLPSTEEFIDRLLAARNLIAVLCGHVHAAGARPIHRGAVQYVTGPGYLNRSRSITIRPR